MRLLHLLLPLLCFACSSTSDDDDRLRVLFIGNSLTATNDLPAIVAAFGEADGRPIRYEALTLPDWSLSDHWLIGSARDVLSDGDFDVVVLQQGPSALPESQDHLKEWAGRWADYGREHGAVPAMLMVWPSETRSGDFPAVVSSYTAAAESAAAKLLPAGTAWLLAWEEAPGLPLYGSDGFHPSASGSYLAALVVYGGIMDDAGLSHLPSELDLPSGSLDISAARADRLKQAAAEALGEMESSASSGITSPSDH